MGKARMRKNWVETSAGMHRIFSPAKFLTDSLFGTARFCKSKENKEESEADGGFVV